jgi:hypothetical protein
VPYLVDSKPGSAGLQSKVFFIWGSTCFCGIIFTFLCIPEVRNSICCRLRISHPADSFRPKDSPSKRSTICIKLSLPSGHLSIADAKIPLLKPSLYMSGDRLIQRVGHLNVVCSQYVDLVAINDGSESDTVFLVIFLGSWFANFV